MKNPQDKPLYIILFAVALAVLLMFYSGDMDASDVQVQCFSDKEIAQIERNIQSDMQMVGEKARVSGMEEAYTKVVITLHEQCGTEGITTVTFPHNEVGTIVMSCPAK